MISMKVRKETVARGWEENKTEYSAWESPMRTGRGLWGWRPLRIRWPKSDFWKQNDYQPWIIVSLFLIALPWAINTIMGTFLFITGDYMTDSLIVSAVVAFIILGVYLRKRSYNNIAREIEQEYETSQKDKR